MVEALEIKKKKPERAKRPSEKDITNDTRVVE